MNKKNKTTVIFFLLGVLIALSGFFGPKAHGILDVSSIVLGGALVIFIASSKRFPIGKDFFLLMFSFLIIITWSFTTWFLNQPDSLWLLMRTARAVLNGLFIFLVFYFLSSRNFLNHKTSFFIIITPLVIQSLIILLQAFIPELQEFMAPLWGFDKQIRVLRGFGLTAGYDTAGYMSAFVAVILMVYSFVFESKQAFLFFLICSFSVLFTSRTSILMLGGLISLALIVVEKKYFWHNPVKIILLCSVIVLVSSYYVIPVMVSSLMGGDPTVVLGKQVSDRFATSDIYATIENHLVFPDGFQANFIGTGATVPWSDIGYIQTIYMGGWTLLFLYVLFYFILSYRANNIIRYRFGNEKGVHNLSKWTIVWKFVCWGFFALMMVANMKNLYFFTRGYHELAMMIFALTCGMRVSILRP